MGIALGCVLSDITNRGNKWTNYVEKDAYHQHLIYMSNSIQYYRVVYQMDNIFSMVNKCCVFTILKNMTYISNDTRCFPCLNGDPDIIVSETICFNKLQFRL